MWQAPDNARIYDATDATWCPLARNETAGWMIRQGSGGGKRVSAATLIREDAHIEDAEQAMARIGQAGLFMIRDQDTGLDQALEKRGYTVIDPVTLYVAAIKTLLETAEPDLMVMDCPRRLAIQESIWKEGGIGAGRFAVMDRVKVPKTYLLGRVENSPAGTAFVAVDDNIAMLHALEVAKPYRQKNLARALSRTAADWASDHGADTLALMTTDANVAANALYQKLGMQIVGHYHYRVAPSERPAQ